jgi:hypothetical protein
MSLISRSDRRARKARLARSSGHSSRVVSPPAEVHALEERVLLSHFRYGNVSWAPVAGQANTFDFTIQMSWRNSAFFGSTNVVGQHANVGSWSFGDGTAGNIDLTVQSVNGAEDWFAGQATLRHTYTSTGDKIAFFDSCCRISTLRNDHDGNEHIETVVNVGTGNRSPVSSLPPIVQVPDNGIFTYQIPAADPDGDPLSYRFSSSAESTLTTPVPGLSVSSTGLLTWDVRDSQRATSPGDLWATQVMIADGKTKVPVDFILQLVAPSAVNHAPVVAASPTGPFLPVTGQFLTFTVTASDQDSGDTINSLQALNAPAGMVFTPFGSPGNPKSITASWTPTLAQASGTYVITFQATDSHGANAQTSVTITPIAANQSPVATAIPGGSYAVAEGGSLTLNGSASTDPDNDPLTYSWDINGDGTFGDATGLSPTLTWAQLNTLGIVDGASTRNVYVQVNDGHGHTATSAPVVLNVTNTAPALSVTGPGAVSEGALYALNLSASDPGQDSISSWTINWGDGSPVSVVAGNLSSATHTYADGPNDYLIQTQATDEDGTYNANQVAVHVDNLAPTLALIGPGVSYEGSTYTLGLSSSDPGQDTITRWDLNWGDGGTSTAPGTATSTDHVFADGPNNYTIGGTATDEDGTYPAGNTVAVHVVNVAPTLVISGQPQVDEGSTYTLNLSSIDPGVDAIQHWTIDWGDGTIDTVAGNPGTAGHVYADGLNYYAISATATDEDGTYNANLVTVTVNDVAPTITLGGADETDEGAPYTLSFSATDPGTDTVSMWTVIWGDGSSTDVTGTANSATHTYADDNGAGHAHITVLATNPDGTYSSDAFEVHLHNVAPQLVGASLTPILDEGSAATLSGTISDPGTDHFTLTVDWGDGSATQAQNYEVGTTAISLTHVYADNNTYHVTGTIADDEGGSTSFALDTQVVNVAPTATATTDRAAIDEGGTVHFSGSFTDPGVLDTHTESWQVTDGHGHVVGGGSGATLAFTPDDSGTYTATYTVTDDDGGVDSQSVMITVANVAPTPSFAAPVPSAGPEGTAISLTGSATDPSSVDTATGLALAWSVTKDGSSYAAGSGDSFNFTPDDNGSYVVTLTATDKDGGNSSVTGTIAVTNVAPTAGLVGSSSGTEGTVIPLTSTVTDPSGVDTSAGFHYAWTVTRSRDGGATFLPYGSGTAASYTLNPDDDGVYRVTLAATDKDGGVSTLVSKDVVVSNVKPTASVTGGDTSGVTAQPRRLSFTGNDVSDADQAAGFTYQVNWGDSTPVETFGPGLHGLNATHVYASTGTYTQTVTAVDKDGASSVAATHSILITVTALQPDPCDPTKTALVVGGTTGNDLILVAPNFFRPGQLIVGMTTYTLTPPPGITPPTLGSFAAPAGAPFGRVIVYGGDGNDVITTLGVLPTHLYGGNGNDWIMGSNGNNLILGGAGNDVLFGGSSRDLIIGGLGADVINGGSLDDLLIGGTTSSDDNEAELCAVMDEWASADTYGVRVAKLTGPTGLFRDGRIWDDAATNVLSGASGQDLFFLGVLDKSDASSTETVRKAKKS